MTPVTVITDKIPGLSIDLLAQQITRVAETLGVPCKKVSPGKEAVEAINHTRVINLLEAEIGVYTELFRWAHPSCFVTVVSGNWDAYTDRQRLHMLSYFLKPRYSGVPMSLVPHSPHTLRCLSDTARTFLSPSTARAVLDNVRLIPCGIEEGFGPGKNDPDFLVVPFNHPTNQKQPALHASISRAYSVLRARVGVIPTHTYWHHPTKLFGELPAETVGVYDVLPQPDTRDEVRSNLSGCGMFLCTSKYESFGLYVIELLASGAVGVFLDKPWIRSLLPGYRYVGSADELPGIMLHVRDNIAEAQDYILSTVRPMILETYTINRFATSLLDLTATLEGTRL